MSVRRIGIVAHSAEGGALCFLTACHAGAEHLGTHMHPEIVVSAIPMGLSMPGWESGEYAEVTRQHVRGIRQVADAGADFWLCPDNTSHIVLEPIAAEQPIPGLHIAHVVGHEIERKGWKRVGLLGTKWTMTGPVYEQALGERGLEKLVPGEADRERLNDLIFDELCRGVFKPSTTEYFVECIKELRDRGAECVVLGCTEIPIIIDETNSPLPVLDSTRLLARAAVRVAVSDDPLKPKDGWLPVV